MQRLGAECPNTFVLTPGRNSHFNPKNWVGQEYLLYLVCQHPQCPHQTGEGYHLREAEEWWIKLNPWLNHLIKFLKFGIPMGKAVGVLYDEVDMDRFQTHIELLEQINQFPTIDNLDTVSSSVTQPHIGHEQRTVGSALRALHNFLIQVDPKHTWGGLCKTLTPDGNILWLCETHRQQYEAKQLIL